MTTIELCRKIIMARLSGCQSIHNVSDKQLDTRQRDLITKHIESACDDVYGLLASVSSHPAIVGPEPIAQGGEALEPKSHPAVLE
jgi:hypothetical protein